MHSVKIFPEKNILLIQASGFLSELELKTASEDLIKKAAKMKPGYDIINDVSKLKLDAQQNKSAIMRAQSFVLRNGVGRIIRVTPEALTKDQFHQIEDEVGYTAIEVGSLQEAFEIFEL